MLAYLWHILQISEDRCNAAGISLSLAFWTLYGVQIIINCIDHVMELLEQDCRYISAGAIYAARTAGVNRPRRGPRANRANKAGRDKPCSSQINANEAAAAAERIDVYANMRWLKSWQRAAEGREELQRSRGRRCQSNDMPACHSRTLRNSEIGQANAAQNY